jgi:hypothetical protein
MFQENRQKAALLTLETTRRWLQAAFDELATQNVASRPSVCSSFSKYPRHSQVQIAVVRAIVDLIFNPPSRRTPPSSPLSSPPSSPQVSSVARQGYPETLYLDHVRLSTLRNDAADLSSLYMLLMLYRQLVHSGATTPGSPKVAVTQDQLLALKKEIWQIGPARLGICFTRKPPSGLANSPRSAEKVAELVSWRNEMDDVVLHIATRADDVRSRSRPGAKSHLSASSSAPPDHRPVPSRAPDGALLKLATSWTDSHLRSDSPLSALMKKRVKQAVEELTVQLALPMLSLEKPNTTTTADEKAHIESGLEPLTAEIRLLAEKLSKLVTIHLNVYGGLYMQPGFVLDHASPLPPAQLDS